MAWIGCCCGCGVGSYSSESTPSLGPCICHRCSPKNKTKQNKTKQNKKTTTTTKKPPLKRTYQCVLIKQAKQKASLCAIFLYLIVVAFVYIRSIFWTLHFYEFNLDRTIAEHLLCTIASQVVVLLHFSNSWAGLSLGKVSFKFRDAELLLSIHLVPPTPARRLVFLHLPIVRVFEVLFPWRSFCR